MMSKEGNTDDLNVTCCCIEDLWEAVSIMLKSSDLGPRWLGQILAPPLISCVILGKLINFSVPHLLHKYNGDSRSRST